MLIRTFCRCSVRQIILTLLRLVREFLKKEIQHKINSHTEVLDHSWSKKMMMTEVLDRQHDAQYLVAKFESLKEILLLKVVKN